MKKCALMAKEALTREVGSHSDIPYVKELEEELLERINKIGIGPGGRWGKYNRAGCQCQHLLRTHIAGLPVAVNIAVMLTRHVIRTI